MLKIFNYHTPESVRREGLGTSAKSTSHLQAAVLRSANKLFFTRIANKNNSADVYQYTADIVHAVRKNGDRALIAYTKKFDNVQLAPGTIRVTEKEFERAARCVSRPVKQAVAAAIRNVRAFHRLQKTKNALTFRGTLGEILTLKSSPLESAGIYIPGGPGGTTPLISTLIMNTVPARIAGVPRIAAVSPPDKNGSLNFNLLYTMSTLGITEAYKIGGPQAIAALAYGTHTVFPVDIITGPGNTWVSTAKKIVYGDVKIDGIFGPSEIVIIADDSADPRLLAADLLSQSEHAGSELSVLITNDSELAKTVNTAISLQISGLSRKDIIKKSLTARGSILIVPDLNAACAAADCIAPEHLELAVRRPEKLLRLIKNAGAVFAGHYAPEPIGDYICGTNHVLPTDGSARFSAPLGVDMFIKKMNIIRYTPRAFHAYARHAAVLAEAEGLTAHRNSLAVRGGL